MNTKTAAVTTGQWLVAGLFAVLCVGVLALFVHVAEPEERRPAAAFVQTYDVAPLNAALAAPRLGQTLAAIAAAGASDGRAEGRLSGSAGCARTEALIRQRFTDAGLEHLVKGSSQLQRLWLFDTQVSDAGLEHLRGLKQLEALGLWS